MTQNDTVQPVPPEFSRIVDIARLKGTTGQDFDITPDTAETGALTAMLNAIKLTKTRFAGSIRPFGKSEWELKGHLGATVVQSCVVTLVPVTTRIEVAVHRLYLRKITLADETEIDPEADSDRELLGSTIDLGLIAVEELVLAMPEYPRAAGAELAQVYQATGDDAAESGSRPFVALKALRDRLPE